MNRCTVESCTRQTNNLGKCDRCAAIPTMLISVRTLVVAAEDVRGKAAAFLMMKALIAKIDDLAQHNIANDTDIDLLEKSLAKVAGRWCKQYRMWSKLDAQRDEAIADAYANRAQ